MRKTLLLLTSVMLTLVLASGVTLLATPKRAAATFPGSNGAIAFVSDEEGDGSQVYRMSPSGANVTKLTAAPGQSELPVWSSDGTKLVFTYTNRRITRYPEIYLRKADGAKVNLTKNWAKDTEAYWFPDRNKIAFVRQKIGQHSNIWTLRFDSTGNTLALTQLTAGKAWEFSPNVSPGGRKIIFTSNRGPGWEWNIFVMKASTPVGPNNRPRNLTPGTCECNAIQPDWSPNGQKIAFVKRRGFAHSVWVMNADGTNPRRLTKDGFNPSWSPDGKKIVFGRSVSALSDSPDYILKMNADGSNKTNLTRQFSDSAVNPSWQPLP